MKTLQDKLIGCRCGRLMLALAFLCGTSMAQTTYTVTADSGTLESPELLENATVTIDDGETRTVKAFGDVTFAANSVFCKCGTGYLQSTTKFGSFTGEIRIEEGAIVLTANGQLGPSESDAPTVVISNGASLVQNNTDPSQNATWRYGNCIIVGGRGVDGKGALRTISTVSTRNALTGGITLTDDTLFYTDKTAVHWGVRSGSTIDLQGHVLAFDGAKTSSGNFALNSVKFKNPGGITVMSDHGYPFFQEDGAVWDGDSSNLLKVESGGCIGGYGAGALNCPWTLALEKNAKIIFSEPNAQWQTADKWVWLGPVEVRGDADVLLDNSTSSCAFAGPLSIPSTNTLHVRRGYLHLKNANNSFEGSIEVDPESTGGQSAPPGLGIWANGAIPADNEQALKLENGNLVLYADECIELPALDCTVGSGKVMTISGNGGVAAALRKEGAGTLEVSANLSVTGKTELAEGILKLAPVPVDYSLRGGLKESYAVIDDADMTESVMNTLFKPVWYTDVIAWQTNETYEIVTSLRSFPMLGEEGGDLLGRWKRYMFARYEGYVWNRTDSDVDWTFALAFCKAGMMFIDGVKVMESSAWNYLLRKNVTLTPGPHSFELRLWANAYENPGARSSTFLEDRTTPVSWKSKFGFVYDTQGRMSADPNDYCWPTNGVAAYNAEGGDGVLFTLDDKTFAQQDPSELGGLRTSFSNLVCRADTVLDLNDTRLALVVPRFEGVTEVRNGDLKITESWALRRTDLKPVAGCLTMNGKLVFAEGMKLDLTAISQPLSGSFVIARAIGGIEGNPILQVIPTQAGQWSLERFTDDTGAYALKLTRHPGLAIIVR